MEYRDRESLLHKFMDNMSAIRSQNRLEVSDHLLEQVGSMLEKSIREPSGLRGKAPAAETFGNSGRGGYPFNMIPSKIPGRCCPELVVLCYEKDNLNERLRRAVYHAGVLCRGTCHTVLFATTGWSPVTYRTHKAAIERLRDDGITFIFLLVSEEGTAVIPA